MLKFHATQLSFWKFIITATKRILSNINDLPWDAILKRRIHGVDSDDWRSAPGACNEVYTEDELPSAGVRGERTNNWKCRARDGDAARRPASRDCSLFLINWLHECSPIHSTCCYQLKTRVHRGGYTSGQNWNCGICDAKWSCSKLY